MHALHTRSPCPWYYRYRIFLILAEFGHSDRNGRILCKKRKNSAKIGMVGSCDVFLSHKSLDHLLEIMNSELIIIANWFKANRLSLNLEKTNFIIFSSLRKKLSTIKPLYINEIPIVQTRSSKFLG